MTIAITGSNGMVGRHLSALLQSKGKKIKKITRNEWDLTDWLSVEDLDRIFAHCSVVFHVAATLPSNSPDVSGNLKALFDANVRSILNLAFWANSREIPIVFISGATVYENVYSSKINESAPKVTNGFGGFYGYSKLLAEQILSHFLADKLKLIILRPTSIYGHGLPEDKLISKYLALAASGQDINISQPSNRINLIHASDVARGAYMAFQNNSWGTFNLSGQIYSIAQIAKTAIEVTNNGSCTFSNPDKNINSFTRFDLDATKAFNEFMFESEINLITGMTWMLNARLV